MRSAAACAAQRAAVRPAVFPSLFVELVGRWPSRGRCSALWQGDAAGWCCGPSGGKAYFQSDGIQRIGTGAVLMDNALTGCTARRVQAPVVRVLVLGAARQPLLPPSGALLQFYPRAQAAMPPGWQGMCRARCLSVFRAKRSQRHLLRQRPGNQAITVLRVSKAHPVVGCGRRPVQFELCHIPSCQGGAFSLRGRPVFVGQSPMIFQRVTSVLAEFKSADAVEQ